MKGFIIFVSIVIVIAILAYVFLVWLPSKKTEDGQACTTPDGKQGNMQGGICVSGRPMADNSEGTPPVSAIPASDYFVNGENVHDTAVVKRGLECAKDFLYLNTSNKFVEALMSALATGGRGGTSAYCLQYGVNCNLLGAITNLNPNQKQWIVNYLSSIQVNPATVQKYQGMAVGNKNMCSVILDDAYSAGIKAGVITGRG